MAEVPFPPGRQLCSELSIVEHPHRRLVRDASPVTSSIPTSKTKIDEEDWLPGNPRVRLQDGIVGQFLKTEFIPYDLNKLAPNLWLVAKQDSSHISSLTHQMVRGRDIFVTEDPGLHLTWSYSRVFIKPLPEYLLSHSFWEYYLVKPESPIPSADREDVLKAVRGFVRSYANLIQHRADYLVATHEDRFGLVPKTIPYPELVRFLECFKDIPDSDVSPRYGFGELRLTRLNFWAKILLLRSTYFKQHGQYGAYFAQFYAPILFLFAVFSLALSSMQVVLAAESFGAVVDGWAGFVSMSRGFSVFTLFVILIVAVFLMGTLLSLIIRETIYAVKDLFKKKMRKRPGSMGGKNVASSGARIDGSV